MSTFFFCFCLKLTKSTATFPWPVDTTHKRWVKWLRFVRIWLWTNWFWPIWKFRSKRLKSLHIDAVDFVEFNLLNIFSSNSICKIFFLRGNSLRHFYYTQTIPNEIQWKNNNKFIYLSLSSLRPQHVCVPPTEIIWQKSNSNTDKRKLHENVHRTTQFETPNVWQDAKRMLLSLSNTHTAFMSALQFSTHTHTQSHRHIVYAFAYSLRCARTT